MFNHKIKPKVPKPYFVNWIIWNRDSPEWRPIYKFDRCSTLEKAERLKAKKQKEKKRWQSLKYQVKKK